MIKGMWCKENLQRLQQNFAVAPFLHVGVLRQKAKTFGPLCIYKSVVVNSLPFVFILLCR